MTSNDIKKITVPIDAATTEQLAEFAQASLGIEIKPRTPVHIARAKVLKAHSGDTITLLQRDTAQVPAPAGAAAALNQAMAPDSKDMLRIFIQPAGDEDEENEPAFVSVNGKAMLIPRGEEVLVPRPYVEALRDAVRYFFPEVKVDPLKGEIGGLGKPREVLTYPFQVIHDPAAARAA